MILDYRDGSANRYRFEALADGAVDFTYSPVTPAHSSTGSYSGGPPRKGRIPAGDPRLAELLARVDRLAAATALHGTARTKGSGAFALSRGGDLREFIVADMTAVREFDAFLAGFGQS